MLQSLITFLLVLPALLAAERPGASQAHDSQSKDAGQAKGAPPVYQELQEPIPTGLDWFHATERELIPGGVLNDAVHNVKKVASLGRNLSNKVIDATSVHHDNVAETVRQLDEYQEVVDNELPNTILAELTARNYTRMQPMYDAIGGTFPEVDENLVHPDPEKEWEAKLEASEEADADGKSADTKKDDSMDDEQPSSLIEAAHASAQSISAAGHQGAAVLAEDHPQARSLPSRTQAQEVAGHVAMPQEADQAMLQLQRMAAGMLSVAQQKNQAQQKDPMEQLHEVAGMMLPPDQPENEGNRIRESSPSSLAQLSKSVAIDRHGGGRIVANESFADPQ